MAVLADATRVEIIPAGSAQVPPAERLAGAWLAGYGTRTRDNYRHSIRSWLAHCAEFGLEPVHGVRRHDIELWARLLEERRGNKPATVANRLAAVRSWYCWLEREEYAEKNPGRYVQMPKVSDESTTIGLSRMQFLMLYEHSQRHPVYHALVCLLAFNGLRISEALGLDIEDISVNRGHHLVKVLGKGSKVTLEPMAPPTWYAVEQAMRGRSAGPLIVSKLGIRMTRHNAYKAIRRLGVEAGIKVRVHPHQLRHFAVTASLDAGVDLRDVQVFARHSKAETTVRYDRNRQRLDRHPTYRVAPFALG